jgi:hypothetical protein
MSVDAEILINYMIILVRETGIASILLINNLVVVVVVVYDIGEAEGYKRQYHC